MRGAGHDNCRDAAIIMRTARAAAAVTYRGVLAAESLFSIAHFFTDGDSIPKLEAKIHGDYDLVGWWQDHIVLAAMARQPSSYERCLRRAKQVFLPQLNRHCTQCCRADHPILRVWTKRQRSAGAGGYRQRRHISL